MSEGPKPVLPLRMGATLTVNSSVRVRVAAKEDTLQISTPFGELTIPYAYITRVRRGISGEVRLDLPGATVTLGLGNLPDIAVNALLDLLEHDRPTPQSSDPSEN